MNLNNLSVARLKAYIQSHGKVVNQRIKVLESSGETQVFAYQYISSKIPDFYKTKSASGHLKLDIKIRGKNRNELLELATIIHNFEKAKTSTISGIKKLNKKIKEGVENKFDTKIDDEEFYNLYRSQAFRWFESRFGSKQFERIVKTYGFEDTTKVILQAYREKKETLVDIEEMFKRGKFKKFNEDDYNFEN